MDLDKSIEPGIKSGAAMLQLSYFIMMMGKLFAQNVVVVVFLKI